MVVLVVAVAVVCLGAFVLEPGVGIALVIVFIIPIVRTAVVISRRAEISAPASWLPTVFMFLGPQALAGIILSVVVVASVGTFFFTCATLGKERRFINTPTIIVWLLTAVMSALVCWPMFLWVRRRWRRDVGEHQ